MAKKKEAQIYIWEQSNRPGRATLQVYDKPNRDGTLSKTKTVRGTLPQLDNFLSALKKRRTLYISGHWNRTFQSGPITKELSKKYHQY